MLDTHHHPCRRRAAQNQPRDFAQACAIFLAWAEREYQVHRSYLRLRTSASSLARLFGGLPVRRIGARELERFKSARRQAGIKEVTIRHDLHALSVFFRFAVRMKWTAVNPVRLVGIPSDKDAIRDKVITTAEERAYFGAARRHPLLYDFTRLILLTGLRPDEALSLTGADLNPTARTITIRKGKTRHARRTLALVPEAFEILSRRAQASGGRYLFPGRRPGAHAAKPYRAHAAACHAAGVRFVMYSLRHTFATRLAEAGVPVPVLAAVLGHSGLRCVHRYVHPSQAAMDAAMMAFENGWNKQVL